MTPLDPKAHRASAALAAATSAYPQAWALADKLRQDNGKPGMPSWPNWCFLPLGGWYAVVSRLRHGGQEITTLASIADVSRLAALGTWRMTQGIYRFDSTLYPVLLKTPIASELTGDALYHLPEWCVYLETPEMAWADSAIHGFWAHLEHDPNDGQPELRLLIDTDDGLIPLMLPLGAGSISDAVDRASAQSQRPAVSRGLSAPSVTAARSVTRPLLEPILSLLLQLCSPAADLTHKGQVAIPSNPTPKKTKKGLRLFPATSPSEWDVGMKPDSALKEKTPLQAE